MARLAWLAGRHCTRPRKPLLHLVDLDECLLGDRERLDQHRDVAERAGDEVHPALVVDTVSVMKP